MKVKFIDVGRDKANWEAELTSIEDTAILREARRGGKIMSTGLDIVFDNDDTMISGSFYVRGIRKVGSFVVLELK